MTTTTTRTDGFVLTLVIVAMALLGVIMGVFAVGANTMLFQADAAQTQAIARNLSASGLAWAQLRIEQGTMADVKEPVELNVAAFGGRDTHLAVSFSDVERDTVAVRIEASSAKSRHTARTTHVYTLPRTP